MVEAYLGFLLSFVLPGGIVSGIHLEVVREGLGWHVDGLVWVHEVMQTQA